MKLPDFSQNFDLISWISIFFKLAFRKRLKISDNVHYKVGYNVSTFVLNFKLSVIQHKYAKVTVKLL